MRIILITDKKISTIQEILPLLEQIVQTGKKLVIIAEDVEGEALSTLIVNKLRGTFTCVAVKAPGFGDRRQGNAQGYRRSDRRHRDFGRAWAMSSRTPICICWAAPARLRCGKENTIIVDGAGNSEAIKARIGVNSSAEIENTTSRL